LTATATRCPYGNSHVIVGEARAILDTVPPTVIVQTLWGRYSVPRIYIAAHGLKAWDVPQLAKKYGWEKVIG